ncbi:MAG: UDP-2,3-diacylglucosamine diphosphatase [Sulfuricellaceae bacterium]|nr:UDP-2,3-diacylglucosamine diphosphatase [Sulfuricellaceae bacterium]
MTHSLLISDLHLSADRPDILAAFARFTTTTARGADALYILGDLFEYWAGDDDIDDPFHQKVVQSLAELHTSGVAIYLLHGNRDFLMGDSLAEAGGLKLLSDPCLIDLHGTPTLLMHGDTLCTDDTAYIAFRTQVRDPAWQQAFLSRSLAQRKAQIEQLRIQSQLAQQSKPAEIMDTNIDSVENTLRQYSYPRLIHGHTHHPATHRHAVDGHICERWVLPDWYDQGGYLRCDAQGCTAVNLTGIPVSLSPNSLPEGEKDAGSLREFYLKEKP